MALGKRCSLCGGKLDRNLKCTECGLDNTKNDDMYKDIMNKNNHNKVPLTHVHEEEQRGNAFDYKKVQTKKISHASSKKEETQGSKNITKIISLIVVILGVLPSLFSLVGEIIEENTYYSEENYSEAIIGYEEYLYPGIYKVGVHIPEGTYTIFLDDGDYGTVDIWEYVDDDTYLNDSFLFERDVMEYVEEVYLYEGEVIEISSEMMAWISSEDASYSDCINEENPLTESYEITGEAVAGVDFPEGFYDIYYISQEDYEYGSVTYSIWSNEKQTMVLESQQYFGNEFGDTWYCNVPFTEGSRIQVEDLQEIILVPSEWVDPALDFSQAGSADVIEEL